MFFIFSLSVSFRKTPAVTWSMENSCSCREEIVPDRQGYKEWTGTGGCFYLQATPIFPLLLA
ncbi:MAG: hypothetical protein KH153_10005 [Bacteroidales bacterium]|nr:hypothetical protein [Bacteroidales bacterium]